MSNSEELTKTAQSRVDARLGFYVHAAVYAGVIGLLWMINLQSATEQLWAVWPTAGWGLGLILHGLDALIWKQRNPANSVRQRMIDAELKKLNA